MNKSEIKLIDCVEVKNSELPHRVTIISFSGDKVEGAGVTLGHALIAALRVGGILNAED